MNAKELRIGNLVNYREGFTESFDFKIVEINSDHINWLSKVDIESEKYRSIKLTEEWFLKCKSNSIFNNGFTYKKTSLGRFEIYAGISLIAVIEFVHELQNLNFALLGEDVVFENES